MTYSSWPKKTRRPKWQEEVKGWPVISQDDISASEKMFSDLEECLDISRLKRIHEESLLVRFEQIRSRRVVRHDELKRMHDASFTYNTHRGSGSGAVRPTRPSTRMYEALINRGYDKRSRRWL